VNLNKSLADELNQLTVFSTAHSNKRIWKRNKDQNPEHMQPTIVCRWHASMCNSHSLTRCCQVS